MARPIKRLHAEPDVVKELRRRSRSTTIGARDIERANIILLRLDGAPKSSPKSSAPALPSIKPRPHE
jgi:hypothetical protein